MSNGEGMVAKSHSRLFSIILSVGIFGLIVGGLIAFVIRPGASSYSIPKYVGSLKLANKTTGAQALTEINKLHGTNIDLLGGFIAEYRAQYGGEHLMVWVGETGSRSAADDLINRMVTAINKGGSPFKNARQITVESHELWQTDSTGGSFFFYASREPAGRVVWLTVQAPNVDSLVALSVKTF